MVPGTTQHDITKGDKGRGGARGVVVLFLMSLDLNECETSFSASHLSCNLHGSCSSRPRRKEQAGFSSWVQLAQVRSYLSGSGLKGASGLRYGRLRRENFGT